MCFFTIKGTSVDGHAFIETVIKQGAVIVCEALPTLPTNKLFIFKYKMQENLGYNGHKFYDHPSTKLKLVGVTGTNGKHLSLLYSIKYIHKRF